MSEAIVLSDASRCESGDKVSRLLEFFGVSAEVHEAAECLKQMADCSSKSSKDGKLRLLGSAKDILRLLEGVEREPGGIQCWKETVHSVFAYNDDDRETEKLAKKFWEHG